MPVRVLAVASALLFLAAIPGTISRAEDAPSVLALSIDLKPPTHGTGVDGGLLYRELARQALLISARDELGLSTRDMALRESMPEQATAHIKRLDLTTDIQAGNHYKFSIKDADSTLLNHAQNWNYGPRDRLSLSTQKLVTDLEEMSRGKLVDALKQAGLKGTSNPRNAEIAVPAEVEAQLRELNYFSQFAALRQLHELQRTQGESPATLAALARGYANLGQLTFFHWNATHKVCRARALLYAARLIKDHPQDAWALWNRGYVNALVGLPGDALEDFAAAEKANSAADKPREAPEWLAVVEAFCRFDDDTIKLGFEREPVRELAALLSYLSVENCGCEALAVSTGMKALQINPECYAICESLGVRNGGVANLHRTTVGGAIILSRSLPVRLKQMKNLPPACQAAAEKAKSARRKPANPDQDDDPNWSDPAGRKAIVAALVEAGDSDRLEPSWELLGRLVEDVTLVHAVRRIQFFTDMLGFTQGSYDDEVAKALEICADHPYVGLVRFVSLDMRDNPQKVARALLEVPLVDVDLSMHTLLARVRNLPDHLGQSRAKLAELRILPLRNCDAIACDREYRIFTGGDASLAKISPKSPLATSLRIRGAKKEEMTPAVMQELESINSTHAVVQRALANRYLEDNDAESAIRCFKRYLEMSPDQSGFKQLADVYLKRDDRPQWQATLEESLKHPDYGLSHARTQVTIADYLMSQGKFKEAKPFAAAAAQTGAAWAMMCAVRCFTGLEEWNEANALLAYLAPRYNMQFQWFEWCQVNQKGDLAAATEAMLPVAQQMFQRGQPSDLDLAGVYYLATSRDSQARTALRRHFERHHVAWAGLTAALLANEAKAPAERDKIFQELEEQLAKDRKHPQFSSVEPIYNLIGWIRQDYSRAPGDQIDTSQLDAILVASPDDPLFTSQSYLLGRYLKHRGETALAKKYLERGTTSNRKDKLFYALVRNLNQSLEDPTQTSRKSQSRSEKASAKPKTTPPKRPEKAGASKSKPAKKPSAEKASSGSR